MDRPERWATDFQETEARYQWAEEQRLLYVAATRAEEQLVVSRYRSPSWSQDKGYWAPLYSFLDDAPALEPPPDPPRFHPEGGDKAFSPEAAAARRARVAEPTYETETVTETPEDVEPAVHASGYGRNFGTAVHELFEYAIARRHQIDIPSNLDGALHAVLTKHEVEQHRSVAERMLAGFLDSELWTTLLHADVVHTELPVAGLADGDCPIVTDGTIDLLYHHNGTWRLMDFKTEPVPPRDRSSILRRYENQLDTYATYWERATESRITEKSLWLADAETEITLSENGPLASDA